MMLHFRGRNFYFLGRRLHASSLSASLSVCNDCVLCAFVFFVQSSFMFCTVTAHYDYLHMFNSLKQMTHSSIQPI